jgi:hypothetical protein
MDVWDMLANLAGAIAGLIVYRFLDRKWMLDTVNVKANE